MVSVDESIQALSRAAQAEARAEAEKVLADARARAEAIRQRAGDEAAAARAEILERAAEEAQRIRSQAIATAQLKARTMQLDRREKLLDAVFAAARERLPGIRQWTDYDQIALFLLKEAVAHLGADAACIRGDEHTQALLTDRVLADVSKELGVKLQLGEPLKRGTGVVVETMDGRRRYDNTLEARLERMQSGLRARVHRLLMGESL
jgi:V/A-type H+-transporting ATPase subunit E